MLIVIPFCHKDALAAVKLLGWIFELDGQSTRHRCLAVGAKGISDELTFAVEDAARKAFLTSKMVRTTAHDERGWPQSCNTLFTCAATYIHDTLKCPFWWNEPDCVPLKTGWLDALEDEYIKSKKPFMGSVVNEPLLHLTGCAIYPHDISFYNYRMLGTENPIAWDCIAPELTLPHTHHTNLFHHCWSVPPKTKKAATFPTLDSLRMIRKDAVVFHRNKDHTLIDRLRERRANHSTIEYHRSDLLPTIIHITEIQPCMSSDDTERIHKAISSWDALYEKKQVVACHLKNPKRTAHGIGDTRNLPYLRELLELGMDNANSGDIIMLTNDDSILHPELPVALMAVIARNGATSSFRLNVESSLGVLDTKPEILSVTYKSDHGRDMFAFSKEWLKEHWKRIPDMFIGELEWDLVMALLIRNSLGITTKTTQLIGSMTDAELPPGYVLHEKHKTKWQNPSTSSAPAKLWNRNHAKAWYESEGLNHLFTL